MRKILISILLVISIAAAAWHWGGMKDDKSIDNPTWMPLCVSADSIYVSWTNEFGMGRHTFCSGLWYSQAQGEYLLTWKDGNKLIMRASNITDLQYGTKDK